MSTVLWLIGSHLLAGGAGAFLWNKYKNAVAAEGVKLSQKL